jgi:hypothetical protein
MTKHNSTSDLLKNLIIKDISRNSSPELSKANNHVKQSPILIENNKNKQKIDNAKNEDDNINENVSK